MGKWLIGLVAVALAASGCTSEGPGQAVPTIGGTRTAPPTSTSTSRSGEAPPISSPELDLAKYENRVCDLLILAQLAPFAIRSPGKAEDTVTGPDCTWRPPDTTAGASVYVSILSKVGFGLDGVYARKNKWSFFENAGDINGYPAVHRAAATDGHEGICGTVVGARRDMVFETEVSVNVRSSAEYRNPCALSDRVASLVIDTLKGGR